MPRKPRSLDNAKPIEQWDDEELQRGQLRRASGNFKGRPPDVPAHVFAQIRAELNRRRLLNVADLIRDSLLEATEVAVSILRDPEARDADKVKVWELLMERGYGKAVQPLIVGRTPDADRPFWEQIAESFAANIEPEQAARTRAILGRVSGRESESPEETIARLQRENESLRKDLMAGGSRPVYDGTSRRVDDEDDDERVIAEILDEEIASEIADGPGEAAG